VNRESQLSPEDAEIGRRALLKGWSTGVEPELVMVRAEGALLWDSDGNEYVDCTSQAWSNNVGASDPRVIEEASRQAADLSHLRSNYDSIPLLRLARRLTELAPEGLNRVSFCLHGSLAVESAMKIALKNTPDAGPFIALRDGYHGRSFATMGASWAHSGRSFDRLYPQVVRVPQPYAYRFARSGENALDDARRCADELRDTIRRGVTGRPAAFIMEPVQGNGTQLDFPHEYYGMVREICDQEGVLLIWDEIQTGCGRTGSFWASDHYGVVPDILIFGKGIGGGFPLAGVLVRDGLEGFDPGDDALTFGQFPPSLAASLAAIRVIEEDDLLDNCRRMGEHATKRLSEMHLRHPLVGDVRGPGLLIGIELVRDRETREPAVHEASEIYRRGIEAGVLFGTTRYAGLGNVVKIKPPLCITVEQLDHALDTLDRILTELEGERA
jgi:4-aminobutyrate aminotransferase-like enzyme